MVRRILRVLSPRRYVDAQFKDTYFRSHEHFWKAYIAKIQTLFSGDWGKLKAGRLFGLLVALTLVFSFAALAKGQTETSVWRDDMSYSSFSQLQAGGWSSEHQVGVSFSASGVILDGSQGDTAIHYLNRFPSGIYDWKVEDKSRWTIGSHSGNNVGAVTEKHSYVFSADGWYNVFAFYRDGQKILTFGSYQEKSNEWIILRMEKHGNQISMYFNDQLQNSYTEVDSVPSQIVTVDLVSPWLGGAEYDYIQVWSTSPIATTPQPIGGDSWTMFGHDATSARYSTSTAPRTSQILWSVALDSQIRTSVTISGNIAYVGSFGGTIYALDASSGAEIWSFSTGGPVWSSPSVANGMVFVGSNDFGVYALSASSGSKIWNFTTGGGVFSSPTIVGSAVYFGSTDNNVYALNSDTGAKIWNFTTGGHVRDSPAVVDGVVYFGSQDGNFYALNAATGALLWSSPTGDGDTFTNSSPAVVNGVVYVGSTDTNLYAFRASDGEKVWSFSTDGKVSSSPAVFNGVVYFGSEDGSIYAVDASAGTEVWSQATDGQVYSSPAIADGIVYVGSWGGRVYGFDASTGGTVWSYATGGGVFSSPSIAGGVMFVGSYDGKVYAFGSSFSPGASSSPAPSSGDFARTAWVPAPASGVAASVITFTAVGAVSAVFAAVSSAPVGVASGFFDKVVDKIRELVPDTAKKWLESFIASKRKLQVDEKKGSPFLPTKSEALVYGLSILFSTFAFSYVKVNSLDQILVVLPTFFATSILVSFVRTYVLAIYSRRRGVWTEYKLWYFGLGLFLVSTVAFRTPFSSPTRTVHHSRNFTERLGGFLSCAALFITLGFGAFFFILYKNGFALVGGTGLAMCLISALFDTFPIEPMGGKDLYKYNKSLWGILFGVTLTLYVLWLAQII
jgi:outer membrane protein assembly factor BamB